MRYILKPLTIFPLLFLCSCQGHKTVNTFFYYQVDYGCLDMGYIEGKNGQNILYGEYTAEVTAIPNDGFVFVEWNDGFKEASRIDQANDQVFVTYYAFFEKIDV